MGDIVGFMIYFCFLCLLIGRYDDYASMSVSFDFLFG